MLVLVIFDLEMSIISCNVSIRSKTLSLSWPSSVFFMAAYHSDVLAFCPRNFLLSHLEYRFSCHARHGLSTEQFSTASTILQYPSTDDILISSRTLEDIVNDSLTSASIRNSQPASDTDLK